jgi:hypothetical protein
VVWGLVAVGLFSPNATTGLKGLIMKADETGFFMRGCWRVVGGLGEHGCFFSR